MLATVTPVARCHVISLLRPLGGEIPELCGGLAEAALEVLAMNNLSRAT